jgi:hypothetical protein
MLNLSPYALPQPLRFGIALICGGLVLCSMRTFLDAILVPRLAYLICRDIARQTALYL